MTLSTETLTVTPGTPPYYSVNVGNINGLGLGTPATNVNQMALGGGELYWFNFYADAVFATSPGSISVKIGSNYTNQEVEAAYVCVGGACTTGNASVLGATYTLWASGLSNGTYSISVGTLIQPTNGTKAFTGADSVTIDVQAASTGTPSEAGLIINLNCQNAVEFTLAQSGSGLTISSASDYSAAWGNVNGIGVGTPTTGLTTYSVSGGEVYETPVSLLPVYSSFSSTTCTLSVYVSSNFVHSAVLSMQDTGTSGGPYTTISLSSASPTTMTTTAASNSTVTRYLGILVSNLNGASAYRGADDATLTYQMTVP